jgi:hypothetical protein
MSNEIKQIPLGISTHGNNQFSNARYVDNSQSEMLFRVLSYTKQAESNLIKNDGDAIGFRAIKLSKGGNK